MSFDITGAVSRLSAEYVSKVECCDECFCNFYCIANGLKNGRKPGSFCSYNVIKCLGELFTYE